MKNPRVIAAITGILAMDPIRGLALVQMTANELKGNGAQLNVSEEWDKMVSRTNTIQTAHSNIQIISEFGYASSPDDAQPGTIAIIPFLYPITKYDWWWAGTETKAALLQKCFDNKNISAVIQLMDTPGGEASAPEGYVKVLRNKNKPVYTITKGLCASAGYWLGCPADKFYTTSPLDMVGSVGTYCTWIDFIKYYEDLGINIKDIYASLSDKKNETYREALKGNFKLLIAELDYINDYFVSQVTEFRGDKFDDIENVKHGQLYYAKEAAAHGLTDGESTIDVIISEVNALVAQNTNSTKKILKF